MKQCDCLVDMLNSHTQVKCDKEAVKFVMYTSCIQPKISFYKYCQKHFNINMIFNEFNCVKILEVTVLTEEQYGKYLLIK